MRPPWNNNIHYHPLLADALPAGCRRALDVGCGEGLLTRRLAASVPDVVGIDVDGGILARAQEQDTAGLVTWVRGDFLAHPFQPGSFDAVVSVATLHHVDAEAGLTRLAELVRPGGVVALIGLARSAWPGDLPFDVLGAVASRLYRARRGHYRQQAPMVWPPALTYPEMRSVTERILPGARFRRRLLLRYSIIWRKPAGAPDAGSSAAR